MEQEGTQRRLNFYGQTIIILLGLIVLRLWTMPIDVLPAAHAEIPDEAQQRLQLIQEVQQSNRLLKSIDDSLKSPLKVVVHGRDPQAKHADPRKEQAR